LKVTAWWKITARDKVQRHDNDLLCEGSMALKVILAGIGIREE
jgi:hypothetical protein